MRSSARLHPRVENGAVEERRFWSYPEPTLERGGSVEEWSERLIAELEESVRMRLMSDVPLGAMLSGGLDSSLIVALMAKQMDRPVQTFAVGFKEAGRATVPMRVSSPNSLGADHHELELSFADETISLERLLWHLDEPFADLSSLGSSRSRDSPRSMSLSRSPARARTSFRRLSEAPGGLDAGAWQRVPAPFRRAPRRWHRRPGRSPPGSPLLQRRVPPSGSWR